MIPFEYPVLRKASNPSLGKEDFLKSLNFIQRFQHVPIITTALVISVDREGGRWNIISGGNDGDNNRVSIPYTLQVRLLTNYYNPDTENDQSNLSFDEYFVLPLFDPNMIVIPQRGEVVNIIFNKPYSNSTKVIGYYTGRNVEFATKEYETFFKKQTAFQQNSITNSGANLVSGEIPKNINKDYFIKPLENYEPFPESFVRKPGDVNQIGQSNTMIRHSFSIFKEKDNNTDNIDTENQFPSQDDQKRGFIEIGTEYRYIEDDTKMTEFDYLDENKRSGLTIEEFKKIRLNHQQKYLDRDRNKNRWEFLNSNGSRILLATKINVDARLIHKDTEKDWTGQFGNVQKLFDKHFTDDKGHGRFCGNEILKETIRIEQKFNNEDGDIELVFSNKRNDIPFDTNQPTLFMESEVFRFISRIGKDVSHGLLGEPTVRLLEKLITILLHQNRSIDILNDLVHRLSVDFLKHFHAVQVGSTLMPLGSPDTQGFIKDHPYYKGITKSDVAGDSKEFDEKGSYSITSDLKARTKEERDLFIDIIKELSSVLSDTFALN